MIHSCPAHPSSIKARRQLRSCCCRGERERRQTNGFNNCISWTHIVCVCVCVCTYTAEGVEWLRKRGIILMDWCSRRRRPTAAIPKQPSSSSSSSAFCLRLLCVRGRPPPRINSRSCNERRALWLSCRNKQRLPDAYVCDVIVPYRAFHVSSCRYFAG